MVIWEYREDVNKYQVLLRRNEDDVKLFIDHFKGDPFPKPWRPIEVFYPTREEVLAGERHDDWYSENVRRGDFPCIGGTVPVFTERALNALLPLIEDSVEVLPLACEEDKLYIINVIDVVDCLDKKHSKLKRFSTGAVMRVEHYAFDSRLLRDKHMFKIPEFGVFVYVSDTFKSMVEQNGFEGLL